MRRSILKVELVRECLDNGGGEVLFGGCPRGRPVPAARRVRLSIRMQRDLTAACRLLDKHFTAVYGDVLDICLRIRVMRRRDGIAIEEIALAAEIVNGKLVSCRRSRHIENAASCRARRGEVLHMARAREFPECAGFELTHIQLGIGSRPAFPKGAVAHAEVDLATAVPLPGRI